MNHEENYKENSHSLICIMFGGLPGFWPDAGYENRF